MEVTAQVIWAITLYKVICLGVGSMFCVLGFKLFFGGVQLVASHFEAAVGNIKILLNSAAPGTFFALLGAAIVVSTIVQGVDFTLNTGRPDNSAPGSEEMHSAPFPELP